MPPVLERDRLRLGKVQRRPNPNLAVLVGTPAEERTGAYVASMSRPSDELSDTVGNNELRGTDVGGGTVTELPTEIFAPAQANAGT